MYRSFICTIVSLVIAIIIGVVLGYQANTKEVEEVSVETPVVYSRPLESLTLQSEEVEEIEVDDFDTFVEYSSMLDASNLTVEELEESLLHDLKPLAPYFLKAEELYGVNAVHLASIAALESGWGQYQFKENNIFGFGSKSFDSTEECIYYVAEFLSREYLSETGRYYAGGVTLHHVNLHYNGSDFWYNNVNAISLEICERINQYRESTNI